MDFSTDCIAIGVATKLASLPCPTKQNGNIHVFRLSYFKMVFDGEDQLSFDIHAMVLSLKRLYKTRDAIPNNRTRRWKTSFKNTQIANDPHVSVRLCVRSAS